MRSWTGPEVRKFKMVYGGKTDADLARYFCRSEEEIVEKARELALAKDKSAFPEPFKMPRWTAEDVEVLVGRYPEMSNLDLAKLLGRSIKSIVSKAHHLGLKKSDNRLKEMGLQNIRERWKGSGSGPT